jgi:transposase
MARLYSQNLRERMVWAVLSGQSRHEVARMFDVSASCVIKVMQRVDVARSLTEAIVRVGLCACALSAAAEGDDPALQ